MVNYNINDFSLGAPSQTGHEVYREAVYLNRKRFVVKKNKHDNPHYSRMEVAFSQLASLTMDSYLHCPQKLVVSHPRDVFGVVTEHLCYAIERKEGLHRNFCALNNSQEDCSYSAHSVDSAEEIPLYFFDQLPHGFFTRLLQAEADNQISIDYASLAGLLTGSYTLEEDDLHKGNFGFYLIEDEGKPKAVFFKIDHDLMFADSIMSFYPARFSHLFSGAHAFDISAEDLLNFPCLTQSSNAYWPTKFSYFSKPWSSKGYYYQNEIESFASLSRIPQFNKAKWRAFYKHILLPEALIKSSLSDCFDKNHAYDRAQITLITQAMVARQAKLKAMLFSLAEFREFVVNMTEEEHGSLLHEIMETAPEESREAMKSEIAAHVLHYQEHCSSEYGFVEGDNPLHVAIKLGDYRYEETLRMYGHLINEKNAAGKTPLDVALDMVQTAEERPADMRRDLRLTMQHLINNGAIQSPEFQAFNVAEQIESYQFNTPYLERAAQAKTYQELKEVLRDLGEDSQFSLKSKKNFAIGCINWFIQANQKNPSLRNILIQLKDDIGKGGTSDPCGAPFQFIRQLRSELWIIRQIRGPYGYTTTQSEINSLIDEQLELLPCPARNCFSFFSAAVDDHSIEPDVSERHDLNPEP